MSSPLPPPTARLDPVPPVRYVLDADDQVIAVNDRWNRFAAENGAPELQTSAIIGRHLWAFISDPTTRAIYADLLRQVRQGQAVSVPFRCDGPTIRREMHLVMSPLDGRAVECTAFCDVEKPTGLVPLWVHDSAHRPDTLLACSWCKRVRIAATWMEAEDALTALPLRREDAPPTLKYGVCPDCIEALRRPAHP